MLVIHNSQIMESTYDPINRWMDIKMYCMSKTVFYSSIKNNEITLFAEKWK
jgi:hypothetical protein